MRVHVVIPGEPCAQLRHRTRRLPTGRVIQYDHPRSRTYKATVQSHLMFARVDGALPEFFSDPVSVLIRATFRLANTRHRKRHPVRTAWRAQRPDIENVAKAILDAATGVLWNDDSQVVRLVIEKVTAAQGEAPRLELIVEAAGPYLPGPLDGGARLPEEGTDRRTDAC